MAGSTQAEIPSQVGRTAVVTGATGALGYEAALALARAGAKVILSGRGAGKGQSAIERIGRDAIGAKVSYEHLDLASLASVMEFADWMRARPSLDLLIGDAGRLGDLRGPPARGLIMPQARDATAAARLRCFEKLTGTYSGSKMQLAKNVIDIGLSTNNLEPMLRFWQQDAAVAFDHVLPVRRGQKQYRHHEQGSVIKLNHHAEPLPEAAPSGYGELIIAREGLREPRRMVDPDGNRVRLVPPGFDGVTQIAVVMAVRSLPEHRSFYGDILGFREQSWSRGVAFRLGESLLLLDQDASATVDPVRQARGWRYITLQVVDIDAVHEDLRGKGVREGLAPITLGDVARISMILDPDGNWIELSRRASIVGSLSA